MINIFRLTKLEIAKALSKKTIIAFVCITIVSLLVLGNTIDNGGGISDLKNWRQSVQVRIDSYTDSLNSDSTVFINDGARNSLVNEIKVLQYRLDNDVPPFIAHSASTMVIRANSLFLLITLGVVMISCYLITTEYSSGTISRCVVTCTKRWKILFSKCLAIAIMAFVFMLLFMLCTVLCGWAKYGFDDFSTDYVYYNGREVVQRNVLLQLMISTFFNSVSICAISALAVFVAVLTKSNLIGIPLCFGIAAVGSLANELLSDWTWLKYTLFANTNYSKFLMNSVRIDGITPTFSLVVLLIHTIVFIGGAFIVFNKRDVTY